eukprot:Partr_v1_DN26742_c1_g1_i3_m8493 putative serine threonineprotein phosphatase
MKLENYGYAIRDADAALQLDPAFIKAYYRRASANMALSKFKESLKDFRMVVKYAPGDPDARAKLKEVEKIVRRVEFEKALSYDVDIKSIVASLNIPGIEVEESYDGMRWADNAELTLEWIMDMISRFEKQKKIHRKYAYRIMVLAKDIFDSLPSLVDVKIPQSGPESFITVCGDIHGQFYDLLNIFKMNGYPSPSHAYLFNGDFVDRGSFSVEVIFTLLAFKILYPSQFFMSRGNHETNDMNRVYGFEGEVKSKYTEAAFKLFSEIFNSIPLCNVIENRAFVVHGGLFSRDDVSLSEIRAINRFRQPSNEGLMCEMLWSDPTSTPGRSLSKRGVGLQFGPDITEAFLKHNNLDILIRSHEVRDCGYEIDHNGKCVTVFSAPNYCDMVGNKGAYINIKRAKWDDYSDRPELVYSYEQFSAVPHPPVKAMHYAPQMLGF